MRLEHYPEQRLKKEILEIAGKHLDLKIFKVFVFGSRVSGKGSDRSDIDVGILGAQKISLSVIANIKEELAQLKTLYQIDVVDFAAVTDDFKTVALQHVEYLNP